MAKSEDSILTKVAVLMVVIAAVVGAKRWGNFGDEKKRDVLPAEAQNLHAATLSEYEEKTPFVESDWLDEHFAVPVPAQGAAPEGWPEITASLHPEQCGACHPTQYADWKDSWHAIGMGPGVLGQMVDWDGTNDKKTRQCSRCHAPLAEQWPFLEDGVPNPDFDAELRAKGLSCAGCHVRAHERFGPPKDGDPIPGAPHDGFQPKDEYDDSRFCYGCHDFRTGEGLESKKLQETYEEWRRTDYAAEGVTCQTCHMPKGRHLFKGVHDLEMVQSGFTATAEASAEGRSLGGTLRVENTGTGHRFPTYSTPQVTLVMEQVDASGTAIKGTTQTDAIGRYVTPNLKVERFDTRLMPGESHALEYSAKLSKKAVALTARVEIWPDEAYRRFYEIKLKKPERHPIGLAEVQKAHQHSIDSRYIAWEQLIELK